MSGTFGLSCAWFDAQGLLLDWDAGFGAEFATVQTPLLPGAPFAEILRRAFSCDRILRAPPPGAGLEDAERRTERWPEGFGAGTSFEYHKEGRVLQVRESRTVSGKILRVATDVTAECLAQGGRTGPPGAPGDAPVAAVDRSDDAPSELLRSAALQTSQSILRLRLRAEQTLQESEARFRTMADSIPQLAWMASADGYIIWYNRRWYEYTGTTPQQMEGWGWQSVHDPLVLPAVMERWQGSIATGQPFEMEFPLRGADGRFRLFLTRVMPLKDAGNRVVQWFGTNTDISQREEIDQLRRELNAQLEQRVTERTHELAANNALLARSNGELEQLAAAYQRTEEALRKREADLKRVQRFARLGSWELDTGTGSVTWSEELYRVFDREVSLPAPDYLEQERMLRPESWARLQEAIGRTSREGTPYELDLELIRPDGTSRWIEAFGEAVRDAGGRIVGLRGTAHDITDRRKTENALRESESRFRSLLESLPQLIWTCWPDGSCYYLSRQWIEYTGIPAEQQWGLRWVEQLHPDDCQRVQDHWLHTVQAEGIYDVEYRLRRADGVYRCFAARGVPIRDGTGRIEQWFGSSTDVEDFKRAEQAILAFNAELEQRVRDRVADLTRAQEVLELRNLDLQQFAYVASHDLKTPLRTISGFMELLGTTYGGQLDAQGTEWIRRASDGAHRLEALIDNLLAYSRLDNQAQPFGPVALEGVWADALQDLGAVLQKSGAEVTAGPLPTVAGDRMQLTRVFQNLLSNAIKYRSATRPRIHVTATCTGPEWVFAVADNGIGIDPQQHERIFELFRRLHTQKTHAGDGIGLTVCRRIVTRHGGKIWVESQPGRGTTVFFTLSAKEPFNP